MPSTRLLLSFEQCAASTPSTHLKPPFFLKLVENIKPKPVILILSRIVILTTTTREEFIHRFDLFEQLHTRGLFYFLMAAIFRPFNVSGRFTKPLAMIVAISALLFVCLPECGRHWSLSLSAVLGSASIGSALFSLPGVKVIERTEPRLLLRLLLLSAPIVVFVYLCAAWNVSHVTTLLYSHVRCTHTHTSSSGLTQAWFVQNIKWVRALSLWDPNIVSAGFMCCWSSN